MKYNCNHNIEYNNIQEDELKNDAYRLDFLKCFNVESYDDTIDKTITDIYLKTKDINKFLFLYSEVAGCYNIVNDFELCLVYLFSYDFLYLFHPIISYYLEKGIILDKEIDELINKIKIK